MPQRFAPLAPPKPRPAAVSAQFIQALPMGELCILALVAMVVFGLI
ncbi:MAG: hypothetical protein JWS10_3276 [Cypionkella sp.]|nr:hypothetical protein [Cypionkella sp.]MDB5660661.1 hypothetical protein [Cypionkella sp.]